MRHTRTTSPGRILARLGVAAALACAGQVVLLPSNAYAATVLNVNSTADVSQSAGACGNSGITTPPGTLSLREATCLANNIGGTVTINVAPGTYRLTNSELTPGLQAGENLSIIGTAGAASTIIDGQGQSRLMSLDDAVLGGVTVTLTGLTLTGGDDSSEGGGGGAVIAGSGNKPTADVLNISNCVFTGNHADAATPNATNQPGGAVQFLGGQLSVSGTTFTNNTSASSSGSAVAYGANGAASPEGLTITGSTFDSNSESNTASNSALSNGGAVSLRGTASSSFTFTGNRFNHNMVIANTGPAIGAAIWQQNGILTATGNTFTTNSVSGGGGTPSGGAIAITGGSATLHYNRFTGNVASAGAALALLNGSSADAAENWWGCSGAPGSTGCDTVSGSPSVPSELLLSATASPATLTGPNATSTVTAALTTDSLGATVGGANLGAFQTLPVTWSDPQPSGATVSAPSSSIASGQATVGYNSQSAVGAGHVVAHFDNATATAAISVNQAPAITSANSTSFTVGVFGTFTVTTTGYPTTAISSSATPPSGISFVDNHNGTATLSGTPAAGTSGVYPLPLTASNGVSPNATQSFTLTIGAPPQFTSPATATFVVGSAGSFSITTSGSPTVTSITRGATAPPSGLTYTDNHNGTATLAGTPVAGTGGTYTISLTATNGLPPDANQTLTIQVNDPPAVTTNPANQTVTPGSSVTFTAAATGTPAPTVQWQRSTDGGASFAAIGGATSTSYTFTTTGADSGNRYRARFTNLAGTATSTAAVLTVGQAPAINSSNSTTFTVGSDGTFTVTTTGFPNPAITHSALPSWLSLTDNGNGTATLSGHPPAGSGGIVSFTIFADNGFTPSDSQAFSLKVNEAPTITSADHTTFTVGSSGTFPVTTSGGFPTAVGFAISPALPSGLSLVNQNDGTALLTGTPPAGFGGVHTYTISANAVGGTTAPSTQTFTLTVDESPTITSADHATFAVGAAGSFLVNTAGGYPAQPALSATSSPALPAGVTFDDQGNGTALLHGTPPAGSGGSYVLSIKAAPGGAAADATQTFTLTIDAPPTITSPNHDTFAFNAAASFMVTTTPGVSSSPVTISTPAAGLPAGITLTDKGDGTAIIGGTPTQSGVFTFTITASNNVAPDATQAFTLTVTRPPSISSADHVTFAVATIGSFAVTTTAGTPAVTVLTGPTAAELPGGVVFDDNGNGTGTLHGTPVAGSGGVYSFSIRASNTAGFTTQTFTLTVDELPAITSGSSTTFAVGSAGTFPVTTTAGYPAATSLTEVSGHRPAWLSLDDNGDGTATLHGTPPAGSGGTIALTIRASNSFGNTDQSFTLNITESPVISSADHVSFAVGTNGSFAVTTIAGTPAATVLTGPTAAQLPGGVVFDDNGDGTGSLHGTPVAGSGRVYSFTIRASNTAGFTTQTFTLTVDELASISSAASTTFAVGSPGTFPVTTVAGYPAATSLAEVSGHRPAWLSFDDNGNGSATLHGTPPAGAGGTIALTIRASNSFGNSDQSFTLNITESPAISSPDNATFTAGQLGTFAVTTTGGYPTPPALSIDDNAGNSKLPPGITFTDNGNGSGTLSGTATAGGSYSFTLRASNAASVDATQPFTLTVHGPPAITSQDRAGFTAGEPGSFTVITRAGVPATPILLSETGALPPGITFVDQGNGTALLAGTAKLAKPGSYPITITASNGIAPDSTQSFVLSIVRAGELNLPPTPPTVSQVLHGVPAVVLGGQVVQLTGSGCASGAPVTIGYYSPRAPLGQFRADANGRFDASVKLPSLPGSHLIVAACYGADGQARYFSTRVTVAQPPLAVGGSPLPGSTGAGGSTGSGGLANTGPDTDPRSTARDAGALAVIGFVLLLLARRRRTTD